MVEMHDPRTRLALADGKRDAAFGEDRGAER
jgi:hypothetical protein